MKKIAFLVGLILIITTLLVGCGEAKTTVASATMIPYEQQFDDVDFSECIYILNKNTMTFHIKWCRSIYDMSERNKVYCNDTRDNIITNGYFPCANCNP